MTPKIDTLNIAYFIPGIVLTFAIALGASEFESRLPGFTGEISITNGAVFLALSYVVGYAMWALGDVAYRSRSDELIGTHMLHYICIEKRIRTHFMELFRRLELPELKELLGHASCQLDNLAGEDCPQWKSDIDNGVPTGVKAKASIRWQVVEFVERIIDVVLRIERQDKLEWKKQLEKRERDRRIQKKYLEELRKNITLAKNAGRVRAIAWDQIYNRGNEYHIGRFLSSWNNVKFAKATMCSLLLGGTFYLGCSVCGNWWGYLSARKAVIIGSYLVFGTAYFWIVKWRLRAFARDLVHGLAPNSDEPGW